jgi:CubicO group peptidase (beta-lactamase class C family)
MQTMNALPMKLRLTLPIASIASIASIVSMLIVVGCHRPVARQPIAETAGDSALSHLVAELGRDTTGTLKGLLVVQRGHAITESYFNGDGPATLHDIRSATKSITSILAGIAVDEQLIANLDAPIEGALPSLAHSAAGETTLRSYLTMRSGLDSDDSDPGSAGNEDRIDESGDWLAFAPTVPRKWATNARYVYSSLNAYLVGAAVENAAGMPLASFAEQTLFRPMGIVSYEWRRGPRGEGVGQGNLRLRLRDFEKFGELMLHSGRYDGRQLVSAAWVARSLAPLVRTGRPIDPYADAYGYMWYQKQFAIAGDSTTVHFASGNGGNKIYIVPSDSLVVAITSSAYNSNYGQRRSEQILLRVLSAMHAARQ